MKGIIFNLFEDFIVDNFGEEKYDEIESHANLITKDPYVGPETYPDEDLIELITSAVNILNIPAHDAIKTFGKYSFPKLIARYPVFVKDIDRLKPFLLTIHDVIHVEVKKLLECADTPEFTYEDPAANKLIMKYKSKRKFCHLAEGFLDGGAAFFDEVIEYKQTKCLLRGDDTCRFEIEFKS